MTPALPPEKGADPRGNVSEVALQRGSNGRWVLVGSEGGRIAADPEDFVEVEP